MKNRIVLGWNNVEKLDYSPYYATWIGYNETLKTILSFQLMQYNTRQYSKNLEYTGAINVYFMNRVLGCSKKEFGIHNI